MDFLVCRAGLIKGRRSPDLANAHLVTPFVSVSRKRCRLDKADSVCDSPNVATVECHSVRLEHPDTPIKTLDPGMRRDDVLGDVGLNIVVPAQAGTPCLEDCSWPVIISKLN